ncbi:MAG: hypothetical protein D6722_10890 [Bacteroidetes bacterium]|nr:MAG: hypothetical protein D6722_10890 [Bacteroidota bacterium]
MEARNYSGRTALIVGDLAGIGREFALLAADDGYGLMLVDESAPSLRALGLELGPALVPVIQAEEPLDAPGLAGELLENCDFYTILHPGFAFPEMAIHIMQFDRLVPAWEGDPDPAAALVESRLPLSTVLELNESFFAHYLQQQRGEVLNVLVRPPGLTGFSLEMYEQSLRLLLDLSTHFNQRSSLSEVCMHTLSYDGEVPRLQSNYAPERASRDIRRPPAASAHDMASLGYRVLAPRRHATGGHNHPTH